MVKNTSSFPLDRLSVSKTQLMIGLSKVVANRGSAPLMAMPCHWFAEVASCTVLIGKPTDADLERSPAVHLAGPHEWDPSVLDYTHPSGDGEPPWSNDPDERFDPSIDEFGDYTQRSIQMLSILENSSISLTHTPTLGANQHFVRSNKHVVNNDTHDYEKFRLYFGWVNAESVQKTMEQCTQWGVSVTKYILYKKHLKSRNPALHIPWRHEPVATDTVFSDTPAVYSGVKQAQVFVGRDNLVADA